MLLHLTYFPNIAHFTAMVKAKSFVFEVCDNYQKQTFRNRCDIYGANGKLSLSIPVTYTQKQRQQFKDVLISNATHWQQQHLKSLDSAYRMSPFYEFYIDDLLPLFNTEFQNLVEFNLKCFKTICGCLEFDCNYSLSEHYTINNSNTQDHRSLVNAKPKIDYTFNPYTQVFTEKHGYLANLSILDLLFNEGPNSINYLESQYLSF